MKKLFTSTFPQPVEPKIVIRFLVIIIILLAYLAGYYHSLWQVQTRKIKDLEAKQLNSEQVIEIKE